MIAALLLSVGIHAATMFTFAYKQRWFADFKIRLHWHHETFKILVPFTLISLVSGLVSPGILVLMRSNIESTLGWQFVGYWQALLKISEVCFSFISLVIASTFFPKVSAIKDAQEVLAETRKFIGILWPTLFIFFGVIMFFSGNILHLIFSSEFEVLRQNLKILLLGDVFKATTWVLSYMLMARNHLYTYMVLELILSLCLYAMCTLGLSRSFDYMIVMQSLHSVLCVCIFAAVIFVLHKAKKL
jgi:O-antigen/teichoic acid export membrane protein